ncbi:Metallo-hydrolase/oxidoreductase [Aspergillus sclerotioniger CBS 115572]|uniref:Metallo-hydrolase/oxidoreductase n=1 Tax=Aspergillus sclerotioniger CBS 115572 TaxID=1450535 RepID=A0A317X3S5_9EURO|nr:Metallo-hydrolase/oxidoreductase [Aspergillus sclerotioniger CBS 115572]PWY93223.1 Metallo-hydrolase/oxidoreductase [Aspergillus sclerotioniger CBS 115572]
MPPSTFKSSVSVTHITTATVLLEINGVAFLTDPVFGEANVPHEITRLFPHATEPVFTSSTEGPALGLDQLPPIDAVLLSHEDHCDNLDPQGRQLLDGRRVITTPDGAKNLAPRPGVFAIESWETQTHHFGGVKYAVTGTPCIHLPGGETTGFVLHTEAFGINGDGRPNVIWIPGDTIYLEEFTQVKDRFNVVLAILNLGAAKVMWPGQEEPLQITMGGSDAARLMQAAGVETIIPVHYESWHHFTELGDELRKVLDKAGLLDKVVWVEPGVKRTIF